MDLSYTSQSRFSSSGSPPSHYPQVRSPTVYVTRVKLKADSRHVVCAVVLTVIQEKVNNPSPDDPFEPDIAAVSPLSPPL